MSEHNTANGNTTGQPELLTQQGLEDLIAEIYDLEQLASADGQFGAWHVSHPEPGKTAFSQGPESGKGKRKEASSSLTIDKTTADAVRLDVVTTEPRTEMKGFVEWTRLVELRGTPQESLSSNRTRVVGLAWIPVNNEREVAKDDVRPGALTRAECETLMRNLDTLKEVVSMSSVPERRRPLTRLIGLFSLGSS